MKIRTPQLKATHKFAWRFGRKLLVATAMSALAAAPSTAPYPYSPANIFGTPRSLTIYPIAGKAIKVPLPFTPGYVAFGPDGKSLYTSLGINPSRPKDWTSGLMKVEFNPTRVVPVSGLSGFGITSIAVSADEEKVLISGGRSENGRANCGIFEVQLRDRQPKQILHNSNCDYESAWTDLSVSANGQEALARHKGELNIIDLLKGTVTSLGREFWAGAWSPDGKWIATLGGENQSRLVLLDPTDLSRRRFLGKTGGGAYWSPDSRYLLLFKDEMRCGLLAYSYSMEILEIQTGNRSIVPSSRCKISGGATGWLSSQIGK